MKSLSKERPQKRGLGPGVSLGQSMLGSTLFKDGIVKLDKRSEQGD